jgi:hypothetical protein
LPVSFALIGKETEKKGNAMQKKLAMIFLRAIRACNAQAITATFPFSMT